MATFTTFKDMFKWNKQLMDDDFNAGKAYTVKHKKDLDGGKSEIETNFKVNEAANGSHKLAADHKIKSKFAEFGGCTFEAKASNEGKIEYKTDWTYLQKYEGLEKMVFKHDGTVNTAKNTIEPKFGFSWSNDKIKT